MAEKLGFVGTSSGEEVGYTSSKAGGPGEDKRLRGGASKRDRF